MAILPLRNLLPSNCLEFVYYFRAQSDPSTSQITLCATGTPLPELDPDWNLIIRPPAGLIFWKKSPFDDSKERYSPSPVSALQ